MHVDPKLLEKTDPLLRKVLEEVAPSESLRVVMVVGPVASATEARPPEPSDFEDRSAYRAALIRQREAQQREGIGPTLDRLAGMGLETRGGKLGRMVVVDGLAGAIARALELPEVRTVALDQPLELTRSAARRAGSSS
jgi:hypothetical protein